jgi:hypothetical protein
VSQVKTNETLREVSLDGMAKERGWYDTDIPILKVNVEGQERPVFQGSEQMLHSQRIQNLFMEGSGGSKTGIERMKQFSAFLFSKPATSSTRLEAFVVLQMKSARQMAVLLKHCPEMCG